MLSPLELVDVFSSVERYLTRALKASAKVGPSTETDLRKTERLVQVRAFRFVPFGFSSFLKTG